MKHAKVPVLRLLLILVLALGAAIRAERQSAPSADAARSHDPFGADVRIGLNQILPDLYNKVPGIARFPWATTAAEYGARINRFSFDWQKVEKESGSFDFTVPEAFVSSDAAHSMLTIATLEHTPFWATSAVTKNPTNQVPSGLSLAFDDPQNTWGQFVLAAARHFRGRIAYYEVWNEPDLYNSLGWAGSQTDFFQLLKVAYLAIKSADPNAQVITGSLNYNPTWLNSVFAADRADPQAAANNFYFDAVGIHSYGRAAGIYDLSHTAQTVLARAGIAGKPVIATELGVPIYDDPPITPQGLVATGDEAASYIIESAASALAGGVDHLLYYRASDVGEPGYWGMFKYGGAARKTAAAFKVVAQYFTNVTGAQLTSGDPITRVELDEGQQHVTVLWNNAPRDAPVTIYQRNAAGGSLIDNVGHVTPIRSDQSGYYHITIPAATNNRGGNASDFLIGGGPYLLVESGPYVPTLTPTITNTPNASDTATGTPPTATTTATATISPTTSATQTATSSPTATATATRTATPSPTATNTATNSPTATATATATFPPSVPASRFAEGAIAVDPGYAEYLNIANANAAPAKLLLSLSGPTGPITTTAGIAAPRALTSIDLSTLHLTPGPISAALHTDRPVAAQRVLFHGRSASLANGAIQPAYTWYLPGMAGARPRSQIIVVSDPGGEAAGLSVQTITASGRIRLITAHVDAHGRRAFVIARLGQDPEIAAIVVADRPVVAEYTASMANPDGITGAMGIRDLSHRWYNAEGYQNLATGDHLAILNPDPSQAAHLTLAFYLPNPPRLRGVARPMGTASVVVGPLGRSSLDLAGYTRAGAFTTVLTSTLPIAVNRTTTFGPARARAATAPSVERSAARWLFPSGDTSTSEAAPGGGRSTNFREFLLLFNPSTSRTARVNLEVDGASGPLLHRGGFALLPRQRLTIDMARLGVAAGRHATVVTSVDGVPIVAEQSVYFNDGLGAYTGPGVALL